MRIPLAILATPILWGMVSVPVSLLLAAGYGDAALAAPYPTSFLLLSLLLSTAYSLFAGFAAAWIARSSELKVGLGGGLALLAVGSAVQVSVWDTLPVWYHLIFLALLIPVCVAGTRLRRSGP